LRANPAILAANPECWDLIETLISFSSSSLFFSSSACDFLHEVVTLIKWLCAGIDLSQCGTIRGALDCPWGYRKLTEDNCRQLAAAKGIFGVSHSWTTYPSGCINQGNTYFFNTHPTGGLRYPQHLWCTPSQYLSSLSFSSDSLHVASGGDRHRGEGGGGEGEEEGGAEKKGEVKVKEPSERKVETRLESTVAQEREREKRESGEERDLPPLLPPSSPLFSLPFSVMQ
jgi:hypothetical protein